VLPSVPTVAEAGLPGYDTGLWWGRGRARWVAAGRWKAKLERSVAEAVKAHGGQVSACSGLGAAPVGSTSDDFCRAIRARI